ncbi:MAG: hypothetical protein QGH62_07105, partial [Nitrospinaceae bacterium]|nr:hypothetical protein [Nitrospinaceae bacterium]
LGLDQQEQMLFCIGRRTRRFSCFADLQNPSLRGYAGQMCREFNVNTENYDQIIDEIMKRFI